VRDRQAANGDFATIRNGVGMIIEPRVRGFICTTAHPAGCATNVREQIAYVLRKGSIPECPKRVAVLGCSTGYGLASRIVGQTEEGNVRLGNSSSPRLCILAKLLGKSDELNVLAGGKTLVDAQSRGARATVDKYFFHLKFSPKRNNISLKNMYYIILQKRQKVNRFGEYSFKNDE
jgi:hypothetical protein